MFNLSKSGLGPDLQDKTTVQHRVLCDWLRNISQQNTQLARRLTLLNQRLDLLLRAVQFDDDAFMEIANDRSKSGPVS